jgi:predicted AlkP superfamily phosphohydrolase/phosphomutase
MMTKPKLLIFGIDGGSWEVILPLIEQGELPHLSALIQKGVHGTLRSTLPPQSAPAWASLITGQNPGRHGILDFWARDLRQYEDPTTQLNQSTAFAGQTIWDYAGAAGFHVGAVSVPVTYPAWPVNGFLISGTLLAPGVNENSAHPSHLATRYGLCLNFPDSYRYGASREDVIQKGPAMMLQRKDVVCQLLAEYPCDLLMVVMGETDKAQHDFWRYREPDCTEEERARYGDVVNEHYRIADRALGEILDTFGDDGLVAIVSDHGAGPYPRREFRTNAWLRECGLLSVQNKPVNFQAAVIGLARRLKRFLPGSLQAALRNTKGAGLAQALRSRYTGLHDIAWNNTQAYRVPMQPPAEGIMINLKGRQPEGIVPPEKYQAKVLEITDGLKELRDPETNEPVIAQVYHRDQVFTGPYTEERTPDLVLLMKANYKGAWGNLPPIIAPVMAAERAQYRGEHTMDGIFILSGPKIRHAARIEGASILDVTPTLLHALELPIATNMDGQVRLDAFESSSPVRYIQPTEGSPDAASHLTEGDEQEVIERLRGLGYVE